ncbi:MAG: DNRLRE domain-containing protein [Sedimentisphaerales bacterium]|nr:DNRLRE domain-containing protein [Sedimentisphaerales bacterium]
MKICCRVLLLMCILASSATAGTTIVKVLPEGDGNIGKYRPGYGWSYEWTAFETDANPNPVYHWYEYGEGSYRDTFLQVGLSGLPEADDILSATLNINLVSKNSDGTLSNLSHAGNSSAATGNASDQIGGTESVGPVSGALGWLSFDVTSFIKNDVSSGYSWAAFQFGNIGYTSMAFSSGEDAVYAPYLAVVSEGGSMVPAPSALGLAVIGVLGIIRKRRG